MTEKRGAVISDDNLYRYVLWRIWDSSLPICVFCCLNPSTADGKTDDPTVRKLRGFATRLGYGGFFLVNVYAYRATDPKTLKMAADPFGPLNHLVMARIITQAGATKYLTKRHVIVAWGGNCREVDGTMTAQILRPGAASLSCLGKTKDGHPRHPLYLPYSATPEPFPGGWPKPAVQQ